VFVVAFVVTLVGVCGVGGDVSQYILEEGYEYIVVRSDDVGVVMDGGVGGGGDGDDDDDDDDNVDNVDNVDKDDEDDDVDDDVDDESSISVISVCIVLDRLYIIGMFIVFILALGDFSGGRGGDRLQGNCWRERYEKK
jgi:hypothetical protein